jgi:hypothetical protein
MYFVHEVIIAFSADAIHVWAGLGFPDRARPPARQEIPQKQTIEPIAAGLPPGPKIRWERPERET